jgi:hypothetical protein
MRQIIPKSLQQYEFWKLKDLIKKIYTVHFVDAFVEET